MPKKSESADIEEPKLENEGTNEEELNVNVNPPPADRKLPTSKPAKVLELCYCNNLCFCLGMYFSLVLNFSKHTLLKMA